MGWKILFTIFFVTLGPIKLIVPFAALTQGADWALRREIALRSFGISLLTAFGMFFFGKFFLENFRVGLDTVRLTAGLILFLGSLEILRRPAVPGKVAESPVPPSKSVAMIPMTFPNILTPIGVAAIVLLSYLAADQGGDATFQVLAMLVIVMGLNLVAMFGSSRILRWMGGTAVLQILGGVLAVLQAVLGMQVIVNGLRGLGVILGG
ncbi:MAG: MarC family protein [Deltaproteobacteria bacterium]|nr:MarC family protein [Deltaproteobacteria bacterium]